jgi:hypothetical protein
MLLVYNFSSETESVLTSDEFCTRGPRDKDFIPVGKEEVKHLTSNLISAKL